MNVLSPADAALAERDPALPGMATVLDAGAVLDTVRAVAPGPPATGARATYVRYKPGTSCVVGYRLATSAGPVLAYAKAHAHGDTAKLGKAWRKQAPDPALDWGVLALEPEAVLVATAFSDRDLPAMAALADPRRREALLRRLLPGHPDVWHAVPTALRHKPERRWVGVVELDGERVALLKAYRTGDVRHARAGQRALAGSRARPLGWSGRLGVLASGWVPGPTLAETLACGAGADVAAVGAALARIHGIDASLPTVTAGDRLAAAVTAADALASVAPELGARAHRVAARAGRHLAAMPPVATVVHGDFSADQVVVGPGSVAIIDFDGAGVSDPATDVASFAADLERAEIERRLPRGRAAEITAELVEGYRAAGGREVEGRVDAFRAVALLRLAVAPFRERYAAWPDAAAAILARAEAAGGALA